MKITRKQLRQLIIESMGDDWSYKQDGPGIMQRRNLKMHRRRDKDYDAPLRDEPWWETEKTDDTPSDMGYNVVSYFKLHKLKDREGNELGYQYWWPVIAEKEKIYGDVFGYDLQTNTVSFRDKQGSETTLPLTAVLK